MGGEEHEISHSPTSQLHREIGVRIPFVDVTRGVAEQSDVNMAVRRHTYSSR